MSQLVTRSNIAFVVACVGNATNMPCSPRARMSTSATAKASSVFPEPGGASTIIRSGSSVEAMSTASHWAQVGWYEAGHPKRRRYKSVVASASEEGGRRGDGKAARFQPRSARSRCWSALSSG